MAYIAAFSVGGLMCSVWAMSIHFLLRETVDQDKLAHSLLTLGIGATATGLVMLAFPESAVSVALAYGLGSAATLAAFLVSGLVPRREPESVATETLRPTAFFRDSSSTLH